MIGDRSSRELIVIRLWIIQELALPRPINILLLCGDREASPYDFRHALNLAGRQMYGTVMAGPWYMTNVMRLLALGEDAIERSLSSIVEEFRSARCHDPRDKIYGMLAMTRTEQTKKVIVNYNKSLLQVIIDAFPSLARLEKSPFHCYVANDTKGFIDTLSYLLPTEEDIQRWLSTSRHPPIKTVLRCPVGDDWKALDGRLTIVAVADDTFIRPPKEIDRLSPEPRMWISFFESEKADWQFIYTRFAPKATDRWIQYKYASTLSWPGGLSPSRMYGIRGNEHDNLLKQARIAGLGSKHSVTILPAFIPVPHKLGLEFRWNSQFKRFHIRDLCLPDPREWLQQITPRSTYAIESLVIVRHNPKAYYPLVPTTVDMNLEAVATMVRENLWQRKHVFEERVEEVTAKNEWRPYDFGLRHEVLVSCQRCSAQPDPLWETPNDMFRCECAWNVS